MNKFLELCRLLGLHPLTAFGMISVDMMLFGGEAGTVGVSWPVSIAVAVALTIPCILVQRFGMKETWGLAAGKGLLIGVLTAIPTPIPSLLTLGGGALGAAGLLLGRKTPQLEQKK